MGSVFSTQRRVEFCETDAAGIAHFSAFLVYMEQAEHEFWRHLGGSVVQPLKDGWHLSWPRVHVECDYHGAAKFEEVLKIQLGILRLGQKSITYQFRFTRDQKAIASGKVIAVCCRVRTGAPLESVSIPSDLQAQLHPYLIAE